MDGFELRESPVSDEQGLRLGRVVSVSGSQVVILLENHDSGSAAEDIGKAMAPFLQVDSTLGRKYDGTGLGLPLTKAFAELHDGSFELNSEVGVGTTVIVRFPAERVR